MRIKTMLFLGVSAAVGFLSFQPIHVNNSKKDEVLMHAIMDGVSQMHFSPKALDDKFSETVFKLHLKNIDKGKRFFLKSDVENFRQFNNQLDDEMRAGTYEFFDVVNKTFDSRFAEVEKIYKEILAQPFDFYKDETIETDGDKLEYCTDINELKERWRKYLKWEVLEEIQVSTAQQEEEKINKKEGFSEKTAQELETSARTKILKRYDDYFKRLSKLTHDERVSMYINAIMAVYDPHTSYFPPEDKKDFDIRMSGKLEGIGAQLQESGEEIKVSNIIPGSPSWKQGELKKDDIILKVAQGDEEPVDVVGMRLNDAVKLVRGKKGTEVRLTVKKTDGKIVVISIIRDVVILEDGFAKSAILKANDKKIGLIDLPSFYADFQDRNGRRCGEDVKEELLKLKADGVNGIIIDLRGNGGGSLQEVVDMAGFFIDKGPIVQVKNRTGSPQVMSDYDPSVVYDGPLAVLVDAHSASASEILAAALQDYQRAVIIGSTSTFGKGTVQRFFSLDDAVPNSLQDIKPLGSIKLTTQKFYRINGGATQLRGVYPDIVLPDTYNYIDMGEKQEDYPLPWTQIEPASYKPVAKNLKKMDIAKSKSKARVSKNDIFNLTENLAKSLKEKKEETTLPLKLDKYISYSNSDKATSKKIKDLMDKERSLGVDYPKADLENIEKIGDEKERTDKKAKLGEWHKNLKKDYEIEEAVFILKDLM